MEKYNLAKNKDNNNSTEVKGSGRKRQYTLAYKKKILAEAAACSKPGDIIALLRREGLASSTLHAWRIAEANGVLKSSRAVKRGPVAQLSDGQKARLDRLEKENYALKKRLERAEAIIDLQKKMAEIMGINIPENSGSKP